MENNRSSTSKVVSPKSECNTEESGWTTYFQDLSYNNNYNGDNINEHDEDSLISCSSSLVSDAASYAAWKISLQKDHHHHHRLPVGPSIAGRSPLKTPKKLSFKKTRTKEISSDDSLEDTASSPANSPKVGLHIIIIIFFFFVVRMFTACFDSLLFSLFFF